MTELKNIMFCATAFAPSLLGAKELPNIIYIVTDQQTASAMSLSLIHISEPTRP